MTDVRSSWQVSLGLQDIGRRINGQSLAPTGKTLKKYQASKNTFAPKGLPSDSVVLCKPQGSVILLLIILEPKTVILFV